MTKEQLEWELFKARETIADLEARLAHINNLAQRLPGVEEGG